jgi:uncharacterized protein (DUF362 family)
MRKCINRREFVQGLGVAAAGWSLRPSYLFPDNLGARSAPTAPVAVAKCAEYGSGVRASLATMFDQLGGLDRLVKGKTVAIKLNMTGEVDDFLAGMPQSMTHWVHPDVIGATVSLMADAGARRVRLLESSLNPSQSLEEFMVKAK